MTDTTPSIKVTEDAFLGGSVMALQPLQGYRAGIDAILLAASVPAPPAGRALTVAELGAGVGVVGLSVARRVPEARVTLLERETELLDIADENIIRNGLSDRVSVVETDVADAGIFPSPIMANSFDHVLANPPFLTDTDCRLPQNRMRATAHAMPADGLMVWVRAMARLARAGGLMTIIHRADALADLLVALTPRFGGLAILPIQPRAQDPAHRVLIQGRKAARSPLQLLPPLVLHDDTNAFRPQVQRLLRNPEPLEVLMKE